MKNDDIAALVRYPIEQAMSAWIRNPADEENQALS